MSRAATDLPHAEIGSPEWRASLLGQAIAYSAHLTGLTCPYALGAHLRSIIGLPEEECGGEIFDVTLMLIRSGLFSVNTVDHRTGDITFAGETKLTASPMLTAYVYGEPDLGSEDEP